MTTLTPMLGRLLVLFSLLGVVLVVACGGGGDDPTPTPSQAPTPSPSPTPAPNPPATSYRLVYREAGNTEDVIWRISPSDASLREEVVRIPHREGYPVLASLSSDGRMLAFLSLPDTARSPESSQADLYVYDLARKETTFVAGGMDYLFRPVWSPDGQLLYMRRYAGAEILSSDVSLLYTRIVRLPNPSDPTPKPTPRPTPTPQPTPTPADATPTPTPSPTPVPEDPIKTMFKARYSQTMTWTPLGFDDDGKSMFIVQINGGLQGASLLGSVNPATFNAIEEAKGQYEVKLKEFLQLFPTPAPDATPSPPPPPDTPPTPTMIPTPTPDAKLVLQLTDQIGEDFSLSPDLRKVVFRAGTIEDGEPVNRIFVADIAAGSVQMFAGQALPVGDQAGVAWLPDSRRLAVGISRYPSSTGAVAVLGLDGGNLEYLPSPETGYDVPRSFAPDSVWLGVSHFSGESPTNPGEASLELVAESGHRISLATGASYSNGDSIIAWQKY